jgi:cytochrome c553
MKGEIKREVTMLTRSWLCLLAVVLTVPALAADTKSLPSNPADELSSQELSYLVGVCEGCHGHGGVSQRDDVPTLAGRPADELFTEIEKFYFYERLCPDVPVDDADVSKGHMSMCDVTSQITKQEAQALARYFESSSPAPSG